MTKLEYLLVCLGEECGEVQQMVGKSLRFGVDDRHQDEVNTNLERLEMEITDVIAVWEMLAEELNFFSELNRDAIELKKDKIEYYRT